MSHVSSISNSSYPYRGTLSRLDANDDGVLSREEREADERPGILEADSNAESSDGTSSALSSLMAKLMQMPIAGTTVTGKSLETNSAFDLDLLTPMDAYNSTYGQYDVDSAAA
ncbi:hypothetical protein MOV66_23950 [Agrobacterium sp. SHOUNA12C]|uniref:hypothetical protein n=1 Tax=Rhizobium rhizogenes TaxID=359 RepID=UPI0004DA0832|nr:hypothetical protein [Rhizobium rhizogenes]MCJ9723123.1 hypothetical protein [Agrobacterium sp. BETTINA12B]MCJ9759717.1 hypothetical protein [Agrobacterium sp. SHOUNA12C]OCJ06632.1 hypothetical protein A6U85_06765 [Agrobacterium sp. 13-626]KEA07431.1 hypothetical protein CN09_10950 [Rhizobium rhizogenes]MQB29090.1 hypothetical protein [Rhizobium rhizogenes]